MDGHSYLINVTLTSGKKWGSKWPSDTLKFAAGELYSVYMNRRERFERSSYTPSQIKTDSITIINFNYRDYNDGMSLLRIKGKAYGNVIEGTIKWTSLAGTRLYSFSGTLL